MVTVMRKGNGVVLQMNGGEGDRERYHAAADARGAAADARDSGREAVEERGCRQLDSHEAEEMLRNGDALMVDVREPRELAVGSIPDSKLIPYSRIGYEIENLKQHAEKPIILSCRSGRRSEFVCKLLKEFGFSRVYNLSGGIEAWRRASRPLVRQAPEATRDWQRS